MEDDVDDVVVAETEAPLRDTISAAFDASELEGVEPVVKEVVKDVKEKGTDAKEEVAEKDPEVVSKEKVGKVDAQTKRPEKVENVAPPATSRAPGSWKPAAREKWAAIPPEIQQEVLRREREIANGFNETTEVRKFKDEFTRTLSPFQHIIAAEGGNPLKVTNNLFTTAAALYSGSPMQKVQTVAALIKNFGVDLQMLDTTLAGQSQNQQQQGSGDAAEFIRNEINAALAPLLRGQAEQGQKQQTDITAEIEAFATDPANEFYEDVRETMADLLEIANKHGKQMDLSTAYGRAIMMHSEISDLVTERKLQQKVQSSNKAAQLARKKAVGVTGAPAREVSSSKRGDSLRSDILDSIESLGT